MPFTYFSFLTCTAWRCGVILLIMNVLNQWLEKCHPVLQLVFRLVLAWVFIDSGWEKLYQLDTFYISAQNYKILPPLLTYFYAACVPWLEILAGVYLLLGLFRRFASALTGALLVSFLIAIAVVLIRGDAIDCGCYVGGHSEPVTWELFARDALFLMMCVYLFFSPVWPVSLDVALTDKQV